MATEVELKFPVDGFQEIAARLRELGCLPGEAAREENFVFDTPDRLLGKRNVLLRLRLTAGLTILTVKGPVRDSTMKVRSEFETRLSCSLDEARQILETLGYEVAASYEKIRQVSRLGEVTVCLDELWFGSFVELEATTEEDLADAAFRLGFDPSCGLSRSYLNLEARARSAESP